MVLGDDVAFCVRKTISFLRSIQLFILANCRPETEDTGQTGSRETPIDINAVRQLTDS